MLNEMIFRNPSGVMWIYCNFDQIYSTVHTVAFTTPTIEITLCKLFHFSHILIGFKWNLTQFICKLDRGIQI